MFSLYIKSLDPLHYYLLQSDIDEFQSHKSTIYDKVLENGDTSLATVIYNRYQQRFDESVNRALDALKKNDFKLRITSRWIWTARRARSKTLEEARALWDKRLRYEYLQEKLSKTKPKISLNAYKRYNRMSRTVHEHDSDDILSST